MEYKVAQTGDTIGGSKFCLAKASAVTWRGAPINADRLRQALFPNVFPAPAKEYYGSKNPGYGRRPAVCHPPEGLFSLNWSSGQGGGAFYAGIVERFQ